MPRIVCLIQSVKFLIVDDWFMNNSNVLYVPNIIVAFTMQLLSPAARLNIIVQHIYVCWLRVRIGHRIHICLSTIINCGSHVCVCECERKRERERGRERGEGGERKSESETESIAYA